MKCVTVWMEGERWACVHKHNITERYFPGYPACIRCTKNYSRSGVLLCARLASLETFNLIKTPVVYTFSGSLRAVVDLGYPGFKSVSFPTGGLLLTQYHNRTILYCTLFVRVWSRITKCRPYSIVVQINTFIRSYEMIRTIMKQCLRYSATAAILKRMSKSWILTHK